MGYCRSLLLHVVEVAHAKWEYLECDAIRGQYYLTVDTKLPFTENIRITPYFFRHFYVKYLYDYKGLAPYIIAAVVGHKNNRTTKENYLKQRLTKDNDAESN